jgi:hypothetical protein
MDDLNQMSNPLLQDWWERYVCPACMSKERSGRDSCAHSWHSVPAVTYTCPESSFSPLSIPVDELQLEGRAERPAFAKYGRTWTRLFGPAAHANAPRYA